MLQKKMNAFEQKAWTLWLQNVIIPFKIKIKDTVLLPDLRFLSCNKKFENSAISMWAGAYLKTDLGATF